MPGSKRKADCTPEEWAKVLLKQREYEREYRKRRDRKEYMKNYLASYVATPEYRKWDNARYDAARREAHLSRHRARTYGVSETLVDTLREIQGRRCAVCRDSLEGRFQDRRGRRGTRTKECLDHDHNTGAARGLLCHHCNRFEGFLQKRGLSVEEFCRRMADYLANPLTRPQRPRARSRS